MKLRLVGCLVSLIVVLTVPLRLAAQTGPRLFFTDLESGPVTGGEDNLGAFVTIYGEGFGATRGSSRVTIGGTEVARYVVWGENNAPARGLDMIVVQPGPDIQTGGIVVTVAGGSSNSLPFTVRTGQIYFVDRTAPNSSDDNPGSATQPFRTLYRPRAVLQAGDIVYIRGGTFTELDPDNPGWDTVLLLNRDTAASGTADRPIAYVGYPGATPVLGQAGARRILMLNQDAGPLSYYTVANLGFTAGQESLPLSGIGHRIIGNRLYDGGFSDGGAMGVNTDSADLRIYGNLLSRNGLEGEKLHHGFYPGGYGTNRNIDFGWNEISGQRGGRAIQLYGHVTGDVIDEIRIHDNVIHGSELNNIVIGGSDGDSDVIGTVYVFNNIISGSRGEPGLRVNTPGGRVVIQNNTFYGNAQAQLFFEREGERRVVLQNNLLQAGPSQSYVLLSGTGAIDSDHNLWYNAGSPPAWDRSAVQGDPRLVNPAGGDYRLGENSPAVDAGTGTGISRDFNGIARPQGSGFDIGAHEYIQPAPTAVSLYFPRLVSSDGTAPGTAGDEYSGFAVVNLSGQEAFLTFTAFGQSGDRIQGAGISNPATRSLQAGRQISLVDIQLFGSGLARPASVGWVRADSSVRQVGGFFLTFDSGLSVLDGADVSSDRMTDFVLTDIERLGTTEIHIANPDSEPATLTFELVVFDGTYRAPPATRTVDANGVLVTELAELFPGVVRTRGDTIRVSSTRGVVPFELLRRGSRFVRGLRGQDAAAGSQRLYCPQYVVGGQTWHSMVKIVNLDTTSTNITYRWIGDDGIQIGPTQVGGIRGRGTISIVGQSNFGNPPDIQSQGYLEIASSDGHRLAGSVVFGDPMEERFSTSLPLTATLEQDMVFSHLASNSTYYTGLAIVNPGSDAAIVTIEVFGSDGSRIESLTETIPGGRRSSQLLTQYFPQLLGQELSAGYIRVVSDRPVASFALFGTHDGSVLSAIPPQIVR